MNKMQVLEMLTTSGFVSLFSAFLLLLAYKWGIVEWMQVHGNDTISKRAHCDFCMSWWLCLLLTLVVAPFIGEWWLLAVPVIATPLSRHWL